MHKKRDNADKHCLVIKLNNHRHFTQPEQPLQINRSVSFHLVGFPAKLTPELYAISLCTDFFGI